MTVFLLALCFLAADGPKGEGLAAEGRWEEPWKEERPDLSGKTRDREKPTSSGQKVVQGLVAFYKNFISPVDGDRCPSYPSCSQYAIEAVRKHGALIGMVMGFGRLIHESDEIRQVPKIRIQDSYRCYDPVDHNDFWWYKKSDQRIAVRRQP